MSTERDRASRPSAIRRMLELGRLREQPATREHVAAVWQKAVASARDAALEGMSIDGALRSAYDAGHLGALALLAINGLRPGGGLGHHEMAFAGAAALGYDGLTDLVSDSMEVRSLRQGSMYDPQIASSDDLRRALTWMHRTLPLVHAALLASDPALEKLLVGYP